MGLHRYRLVGLKTGNLQGENIGTFARGQGGLAALGFGLGIDAFCLAAFLQCSHDLDLAKTYRHPSHGRITGERETIARFDHLVTGGVGIAEGLDQA